MSWSKDIKQLMREQGCSREFIDEVVRIVGTRDIDWDDYGYQITTHEVDLTLINPHNDRTFKLTIRED